MSLVGMELDTNHIDKQMPCFSLRRLLNIIDIILPTSNDFMEAINNAKKDNS